MGEKAEGKGGTESLWELTAENLAALAISERNIYNFNKDTSITPTTTQDHQPMGHISS